MKAKTLPNRCIPAIAMIRKRDSNSSPADALSKITRCVSLMKTAKHFRGQSRRNCLQGTKRHPGYFQNPEASEELLKGGWLHTGDLGFILDGDLYISGKTERSGHHQRTKLPAAGDQWVVEEIPGIRKGAWLHSRSAVTPPKS